MEPTFSVLTDVAEKMVLPPPAEDGSKAKGNPVASQQARWEATNPPQLLATGLFLFTSPPHVLLERPCLSFPFPQSPPGWSWRGAAMRGAPT